MPWCQGGGPGAAPQQLQGSCLRTFSGHQNERNFVGLSVDAGQFIACGSETNQVGAGAAVEAYFDFKCHLENLAVRLWRGVWGEGDLVTRAFFGRIVEAICLPTCVWVPCLRTHTPKPLHVRGGCATTGHYMMTYFVSPVDT